ncbi:hypothetical protein LCGC14_1743440 [marine sediment metagenome]|uniref:Uncharacterized protein n=1 Tax=marine sediment metagenome TaxID=412755 RepID=A0A0F9H611_9ZZZZ|nr:MAG: hypothetical protein Lokiarch_27060 [Candidatus Lokiarchaeum sp. GC14_75]
MHSTMGEVRGLQWFSDDLRIKALGAEYNEGVSETINLEFTMESERNFLEFRFIIEGINIIIKP